MYVSEINHTNFDGRVQVDACVVGRTLKERENVRDKVGYEKILPQQTY